VRKRGRGESFPGVGASYGRAGERAGTGTEVIMVIAGVVAGAAVLVCACTAAVVRRRRGSRG
jgi:hypothetical protein